MRYMGFVQMAPDIGEAPEALYRAMDEHISKEVVGGYSVLEFRSHAEAVEEARRLVELHNEHWPGWEGAVVVRRIHGGPEE